VEFLTRAALDSLEGLVKNIPATILEISEWDELASRLAHLLYKVIPVELARYTTQEGFTMPPQSPAVPKTTESYEFDESVYDVKTPYGEGEIIAERKDGGAIIKLGWGATLHTGSKEEFLNQGGQSGAEATSTVEGTERPGSLITGEHQDNAGTSVGCEAVLGNEQAVMTKAVAVLRVQKLVDLLLSEHGMYLTGDQVGWVVDAVSASCESAAAFNADLPMRAQLAVHGFMLERGPGSGLPHLLDQECQALSLLLHTFIEIEAILAADGTAATEQKTNQQTPTLERINSRPTIKYQFPSDLDVQSLLIGRVSRQWVPMDETSDDQSSMDIVNSILRSLCHRVFNNFVASEKLVSRVSQMNQLPPSPSVDESKSAEGLEQQQQLSKEDQQSALVAAHLEVSALRPVVLDTLKDLSGLSEYQLLLQMQWLYPSLINLIPCQSIEVREKVVKVLQLLSPRVIKLCQMESL